MEKNKESKERKFVEDCRKKTQAILKNIKSLSALASTRKMTLDAEKTKEIETAIKTALKAAVHDLQTVKSDESEEFNFSSDM
jgi:hypothetical protein